MLYYISYLTGDLKNIKLFNIALDIRLIALITITKILTHTETI